MELALIVIALLGYGVSYAYSGVDNALYYRAANHLDSLTRRVVTEGLPHILTRRVVTEGLPHIHTAENVQSWGRHVLAAALTLALDPSWTFVLLWVAVWCAANVASYWFNQFIWSNRRETDKYYQPGIGWVPKPFANRRTLQVVVCFTVGGLALLAWGWLRYA